MPDIPRSAITALILAGGQASRMGGIDKGLLECAGQPLIGRVLRAVEPLVHAVVISANRNQSRYARFGHPVVSDRRADYPGPLAGIERGLEVCETEFLWVVPCDAPGLDAELLSRLTDACRRQDAVAAVAEDGGFLQPTFALMRRDALDSLRVFLDAGRYRVQDWLATLPAAHVDCADHPDWFANINTPADLGRCAARLGQSS